MWVPCGFLWLFAPVETYLLLKSSSRLIPWTALNIAKLLITLSLFLISLAEFSYAGHAALSEGVALPSVYFYTPFLKLATFLLAATLLLAGKKRGIRSSGTLFLFWLLLLLCGLVAYRSHLKHALAADPGEEDESYHPPNERVGQAFFFGTYMAYYPLVLVQFLLNCFADTKPVYRQHAPSSEEVMMTLWKSVKTLRIRTSATTRSLLRPGYGQWWTRQILRWHLAPSGFISPDMECGVDASFARVLPRTDMAASFHNHVNHEGEVKFSEPSNKSAGAKPSQLSIVRALAKTFGPMFVAGSVLKLGTDTLQFVSPQILRAMIGFVGSGEPLWKGIFYAVLMFATATLQSLLLSAYFQRMYIVGMRIRTCLISAIYRKSLVLSNAAKKESTTGEIVNLMSNDAQKFMELMVFLNMLWSAPFQIALALYFLWDLLGVAVLSGVGVMVLMVPINGFLAAYSKKLQTRQMKHKDERIKLMNEILGGMKVLKLYAWERSFEKQVQDIREKEVANLRTMAYLSSVLSFLWNCAPFLVSLMSFMTYVLMSNENVLGPQKAFVSLTLFNILRFPLSMLPMLISMLVQASVSVKRMNKYLGNEELEEYVTHEKDDVNPVTVEHGSFAWTRDEEPVLRDVNIKIPKGKLVALVGQVGAGKSSLLSALLGDMERIQGTVNIHGSVAYIAQQAWIQNATVRDNILFQKPMERERYNRVLEQCALQSDLSVLPGGDMTEIGEKGINLSGGQKQRVSLARAVYSDTDIYFLDDPLSAVDSHVGRHIFENVIGPNGALKNKTRVLVTHGISYLPQVDHILVLKDGRVEEQGSYKELLSQKGAFAEVLLHFLREESQEDDLLDTDPNIVEELILQVGNPEINSLSRQLSESASVESTPVRAGSMDLSNRKSSNASSMQSNRTLSRSRSRSQVTLKGEKGAAETEPTKLVQAEFAETGQVKWRVYFAYFGAIGAAWLVPIVLMNVASSAFSLGSNLWLTAWSNDPPLPDGTQDLGKRDLRLGVYGGLGLGQGGTISKASFLLIKPVGIWRCLHYPCSVTSNAHITCVVVSMGLALNLTAWGGTVRRPPPPQQSTRCEEVLFLRPKVCISPALYGFYGSRLFYIATSRQLKRLESVTRSPIYTHFSETLSGVSTIRAYGAQERFVLESNHRVDYNQMCYYPSTISNRWLAVRLEFCGNLIVLFAALFSVFGSQALDGGTVGLSLSYALSITATMNWMVRMSCEFETNIVAVERIMEYTRSPTEAAWEVPESKPALDWPMGGQVQFADYSTRYREGMDLVIKDITVSINAGEKVGVVGRTGAGKSSLMLSLFRIVEPAKGTIFIDGVDVTKIGLHDLRSKLTIIPQASDPILFSGTLRTNLDPFGEKSDTELWSALELSHLKTFVSGLDKGLEYQVAEGGENLSVGQRQLVCLARALLRKSKVLVLDEATAAVDMETDSLIQQTIRKEFTGCTVLTIAHRLNTIMDYDRILVLEQGRVAEFDTPSNLLANESSIFYSMAKDADLA
ncbi:unnamed protein product [Ixodes persulcatus]